MIAKRIKGFAEHEDGTITVSPSILVKGHDDGEETEVHGYLEKGVWRDC